MANRKGRPNSQRASTGRFSNTKNLSTNVRSGTPATPSTPNRGLISSRAVTTRVPAKTPNLPSVNVDNVTQGRGRPRPKAIRGPVQDAEVVRPRASVGSRFGSVRGRRLRPTAHRRRSPSRRRRSPRSFDFRPRSRPVRTAGRRSRRRLRLVALRDGSRRRSSVARRIARTAARPKSVPRLRSRSPHGNDVAATP